MTKSIKFILALFFLQLFAISIFSQIVVLKDSINLQREDNENIDVRVDNLDTYIDLALRNSPLMQVSEIEIAKIMEAIKMQKKSWLDYIYIDANSRYGLFNQVTISELNSQGGEAVGLQSAKQQFNYYAGVALKIPLSNFTSKKNELKIFNNTINESKLRRKQLEIDISQLVIEEYFKLISSQKVMKVNQATFQTMKVSYLTALKETENGNMDMNALGVIATNYGKVEESYIIAMNEFYAQYYKLQILTGSYSKK